MKLRLSLTVVVVLAVAGACYAAVTIPMSVDGSQTSAQGYGGSAAGTLSDPFAYNPDGPTSASPDQVFNGSDGYHSANNVGPNTIGYVFAGGSRTGVSLDIWGRIAPTEVGRHQNLTIDLYNGDWITPVHTTTGFNGVGGPTQYYGRFAAPPDVTADRAKITKSGDWFVFMEARAANAANIARADGVRVVGGSSAVKPPSVINDGVLTDSASTSAFMNPPLAPQGQGYDLGGWANVELVQIYQHSAVGGGGTRRRLETVTVYTSAGPMTFSGLPDQDVIDLDLGGVKTAYVFVKPVAQHAGSPDPQIGIREIQVFTDGSEIQPWKNVALGAAATLQGVGWNANSGSPGILTDGVTAWGPDLANFSTAVFNNNIAGSNSIELDLGSPQYLSTLGIVQQTYGLGGARRMIEDLLLEFSNDGFSSTLGSASLTLADGVVYQQLDFSTMQAQYVRLSPLTQYGTGSDGNIGIVEIQFFGVPEPSTLAIWSLGLLGLIGWRRRRTK